MRILWNEVKKIFTWKTMLLLVFVNSLLYFLLIEFYITYFPNGSGMYSYNLGVEMVETYGASMDEEEYNDFKKKYDERVEEADHYLQSREEFVAEGLDTYEKFQAYDWLNASANAESLRSTVFTLHGTDLFWELQERERLMSFFEQRKTMPEGLTGTYKNRYEELIAEDKIGAYTEMIIQNFKHFIMNVGIAILFSVVLVISPTMLKDRTGGILPLQYTSKKGRKLFTTKLFAGYISAFMIITGLLVVYFSLYTLNNTSMFFKVHVNTFIANESWLDPTFFQFILLCIAAIYLIGFFFVTLSMGFSSKVPNLVSLIGIQIPFVVGFLVFGLKPLLPNMILIWTPKWLAPLSYSAMTLLSVCIVLFLWRREKKMDIL